MKPSILLILTGCILMAFVASCSKSEPTTKSRNATKATQAADDAAKYLDVLGSLFSNETKDIEKLEKSLLDESNLATALRTVLDLKPMYERANSLLKADFTISSKVKLANRQLSGVFQKRIDRLTAIEKAISNRNTQLASQLLQDEAVSKVEREAEIEKIVAPLINDLEAANHPAAPSNRKKRILCSQNLQNICLAAKIFATDHSDKFPNSFLELKNDLSAPKILFCPADTDRTPVESWDQVSPANCSYEFLSPNANEADVQNKEVFRCRVHGSYALGDGSVKIVSTQHLDSSSGK
jgi:hypothetical protein